MRKNWTQEEVDLFIKMYPDTDWRVLEETFGRSKDTMVHKAKRLGILRKVKAEAKWTHEEIKYLEDNYGKASLEEMIKYLGKTKSSVETKCKRLGLVSRTLWTEEEKELMKEYYPRFTNETLHKCMFPNRSVIAIDGMGQRMGLTKDWIPWQKTKHFEIEGLINRISKLKEGLGRVPTSKEIEKYGVASQKTIERYFNGYRNLCKTLGWEINFKLFGKDNLYLSDNGDYCFSEGEVFITNFFVKNDIPYIKDGYYKDYFHIRDFGTKKFDWLIKNQIAVELFGLSNNKEYRERMENKIQLCADNNIPLIALFPKDLNNLEKIFKNIINTQNP